MRVQARLAAFALVLALSAGPADAEPVGRHAYLIPFGGVTIFDGDLRFPQAHLVDDLNVGGRLGYQWLPWLGVEVGGGFTPTNEDTAGGADIDFYHLSGNLALTPYQGRWGGPFVLIGGGLSNLRASELDRDEQQGNFELGAGVRFWLTDGIGLRIEGRDLMWLPKEDVADIKTHTLVLGAGINLALGAQSRDTDGDGVPDRKDTCPDTPTGATVDASGCTMDTDGDKVVDGLDQCANTPQGATVDAKGCPSDADGDKVLDGLDQCADTPKGATVDGKGCPSDADGDAVLDGLDQCANTPTGAQVDATGCPRDSDGDGVFDGLDQCPDTQIGLKVDATGCAIEVVERETELLDTGMMRIQNVNFDTGKSELLPESLPVLDVVGAVLSKWPELRMEIGGHTDSRGSTERNQKLSEARAQAVLDYLLSKFPDLKKEQYSVKGHGEAKPFVPNNSPANMTLNRRVEFVVLNKETLRKEYERRRLLKQGEGTEEKK